MKKYSWYISDTNYSATIGLTDASSGDHTDDINPIYTEVLTRHNLSGTGTADNYTWRSIRAIQPDIQPTVSIQAGSGIEVSGNTVSLTSGYVNQGVNSASTNMYVMARDSGSSMSDLIGWGRVSIPRGVIAGTGLTSTTYNNTTDTISLSQDAQNKLARIPDLPSADGNYALTCTISGGVPTFAWTLANYLIIKINILLKART